MKIPSLLLLTLALLSAALPAHAIKGMYECFGPHGEHYYSDKGCIKPDPPPPVPGGTLTLLPSKHSAASPADPAVKFRTHNRYTQRAETGAATADRQNSK